MIVTALASSCKHLTLLCTYRFSSLRFLQSIFDPQFYYFSNPITFFVLNSIFDFPVCGLTLLIAPFSEMASSLFNALRKSSKFSWTSISTKNFSLVTTELGNHTAKWMQVVISFQFSRELLYCSMINLFIALHYVGFYLISLWTIKGYGV